MIYILILIVGVLIGHFAGPLLLRTYRISQYSYAKGFQNGRWVSAAIARKVERDLCPACRDNVGKSLRWIAKGGKNEDQ